jgi:hypothetical protein
MGARSFCPIATTLDTHKLPSTCTQYRLLHVALSTAEAASNGKGGQVIAICEKRIEQLQITGLNIGHPCWCTKSQNVSLFNYHSHTLFCTRYLGD